MNATLQCLSQIEKLVDYFKYNQRVNETIQNYKAKGTLCLSESYKYLIENLWPSNDEYISKKNNQKNNINSYFSPYEFKQKISDMNSIFKGAVANEAKDLINFIIMKLHEELNKAKKNISFKNLSDIQLDQANQMLIFNSFFQNFVYENQSIISDLFYAASSTYTQCSGCNIKKYNFQTYFFLIFQLEEIRKYKIELLQSNLKNNVNLNIMSSRNQPNIININQNNMYQQKNLEFQKINSVNIVDCFNYNQKMEYFRGENSMYCNFCKKVLPAYYRTFLYTGPEILIIILNRGKRNQFKVKLEFKEQLDLSNFIIRKETGYMYNLIGVISPIGEMSETSHFFACCKSPIDNKWYKYNDESVTPVNNYKEEIIGHTMSYILFYQKIDNNF